MTITRNPREAALEAVIAAAREVEDAPTLGEIMKRLEKLKEAVAAYNMIVASGDVLPAADGGWRPIEEAPRYGHVLLFGRQADHHADMVHYEEPLVFTGYWDVHDEAWCATGSTWTGPFFEPTHFMPLPPPPVPQSGEEQ